MYSEIVYKETNNEQRTMNRCQPRSDCQRRRRWVDANAICTMGMTKRLFGNEWFVFGPPTPIGFILYFVLLVVLQCGVCVCAGVGWIRTGIHIPVEGVICYVLSSTRRQTANGKRETEVSETNRRDTRRTIQLPVPVSNYSWWDRGVGAWSWNLELSNT